MESIFGAICAFLITNKAAILSKVIASASYDTLKKVLNFSDLKKRISNFFDKEEKIDEYLKEICSKQASNPNEPESDIEEVYEKLTQKQYDREIFEQIKEWVRDNEKEIASVSMNFNSESGFNIGTQNAGKNIFNINGDYKPHKD